MLKVKYIIKDIENNILFGDGSITTLVYNLADRNKLRINAETETINFQYLIDDIEIIKISVPYEMFWESSTTTEVITSIIKTISKVGELGRKQFCE